MKPKAYYISLHEEKERHNMRIRLFAEIETTFDEPHVCKKFGCGKMLSLQERRFGKYCIDHQPVNQVQNIRE